MDAPLAESDPLLTAVVAEPTHYAGGGPDRPWRYASEWDVSFRPDDPEGGFNRYGWNETDQAAFETLWPADGDRWIDELIADYAGMWPWLITRVLQARAPELEVGLRRLHVEKVIGRPPSGAWGEAKRRRPDESAYTTTISVSADGEVALTAPAKPEPRQRVWGPDFHNGEDAVVMVGLQYGPFHHARARRTWPDPPIFRCRICGKRQEARYLHYWMLERHGPPRYCEDCNIRIRTGRYVRRKADVVSGVRRLAEALERIPGQQVHLEPLHGYDPEKRDEVAAALIVAPDPFWAQKQVAGKWLDVLKAAGLVEGAWRPARGTYCTAADGHPCRSLSERSVDDWLSTRGVEHEPEPRYPGSNRRADWGLGDGTLVEYAGLLGDKKYAAKIEEKRGIAGAAGVRLVVLVPEDLRDLGARLGEWAEHT